MCIHCSEVGPPPDSILSMPPPPLPSFLLPKTALIALAQNESQPCFATYMCETSPNPRVQSGIEYIELPGQSVDDVWLFIVIASLVGLILLFTVLVFMFMKCREESEQKHLPPKNMCHEPHVSMEKSQTFSTGTILYPQHTNEQALQQEMHKESRLLWATLTPHGTRHFVSPAGEYANYEDHYEVVDYRVKPVKTTPKKIPIKSFDNSGFSDFDYEDMHLTNAIDLYHDDHDSGYQEPHEVIGTLNRQLNASRLMVSSPTRIEHPNMPPLNVHPTLRSHANGTMSRKSTLTRRTTESLNYYGQGTNI